MAANPSMASLSTAICKGVVEGIAPLIEALRGTAAKNHDLRDIVQTNTDKLYALDGEVKLLKGFVVSLMGTGDGSSGSVPSLQKDVRTLGEDMNTLKVDVRDLKVDLRGMADDMKAIRTAQSTQDAHANRMAGGVAVGRWLIGACITVIGGVAAALVYLFSHGVKP